MSYRTSLIVAAVVLFAFDGRPGLAQEFRVYTRVYNLAPAATAPRAKKPAGPPIIARSLSLFHAGKVYDYIPGVKEVTIFEPARNRFTLLSTSRTMATTVEFDELRQMLKMARHGTEQYLGQLSEQQKATFDKVADPIRFQLDPRFEEQFEQNGRRLKLTSRHLSYEVRCAEIKSPEAVEGYLRYADWMARLNFVLHPQALYPEPRLALNASLRRLQMVPTEVELRAEIDGRLHLRAQHDFGWELDAQDRSLIHDWETLLKSRQTEHVTFREYQRALLAKDSAP